MAAKLDGDGVFRPAAKVSSIEGARGAREERERRSAEDAYDVALRESLLSVTKKGKAPVPLPLLANAKQILLFDRRWFGSLAWDDFRGCAVLLREPPFRRRLAARDWNDADEAATREWLQRTYDLDFRASDVAAAVELAALETQFHSVRDYLRGLRWDGTARLDAWLSTHLGCIDSVWTRIVGPKWMISAVARAFHPGCKVDTMIVLEGRQGKRKSSAIEILAGTDNFACELAELGSRDAATQLRGVWIYEMQEMQALEGISIEKVKSFVSAKFDRHVGKWKRYAERVERGVVFAGTGNRNEYLRDPSGARRFWPVECVFEIDLALLAADRDQLWAEAVSRYRAGERWHLDEAETAVALDEQEARQVADASDVLLPRVLHFLETSGPEGGAASWTQLHFLSDHLYGDRCDKVGDRETKLLVKCLGKLGWTRQKDSIAGPSGTRDWRYRPKPKAVSAP